MYNTTVQNVNFSTSIRQVVYSDKIFSNTISTSILSQMSYLENRINIAALIYIF